MLQTYIPLEESLHIFLVNGFLCLIFTIARIGENVVYLFFR